MRASYSVIILLLAVSLASIFNLASAETIIVAGTMHPGVEAGCWLIRADATGTDYLLLDPPEALRVDGLHVQVTGEVKTDVASYCMQGSAMLHITSYSPLSSWSTTDSTLNVTCTTTWTHTGDYVPVTSGVCQQIIPSNPIAETFTYLWSLWNWFRGLLCGFGFCF